MSGSQILGCHKSERYFFNLQEAKYRKGNRWSRATRSGYWKATGRRERTILSSKGDEIVGMKKVLVFHHGKPPHGVRTPWTMHEYRLAGPETLAASSSQVRFPNIVCICLLGYPYYLVEYAIVLW